MAIQPRGRKRRLVLRIEEETGPTPETKAKLRADRLQELFAKGLIDDQQRSAAEEIRSIFDAISALWFKGSVSGDEASTGRAGSSHHLDGLPLHILVPYKRRYLPWMHMMGAKRFKGLRYSEIIVGIIVDCHAVEDYPDGVVAVVREALDAY